MYVDKHNEKIKEKKKEKTMFLDIGIKKLDSLLVYVFSLRL